VTLKIASGAETFEPAADIRPSEAPVIFGRYWSVDALVEHGDARGRTLGFPTANMHLPEESPLAFGVYAVRVGIFAEGKLGPVHNGVANFGIRPMYRISRPLLEVHVLDFDGDLYDKILRVQFVAYLRPESAFTGVEALVRQIGEDARAARELLARAPRTWSAAVA
jgi:riboflavin kinase/FMN adenylyltransferase